MAVLVDDLRANPVARLVAQMFQALNAWVGYHSCSTDPEVHRLRAEMRVALDDYMACDTNLERFLWLTWAFHIQHRRGSVIADWWDWAELPGVDGEVMWHLIDRAQQDGPHAVFTDDELADFLDSDECPVHLFLFGDDEEV